MTDSATNSSADLARADLDLISRFGEHPARLAAQSSMQAVAAGDRDRWLSLFSGDAHLEDPVGVSPLDPTGLGHRGPEAIALFWDTTIGPNRIEFRIDASYAVGSECANVGSITTHLPDGSTATTNGVYTYRVDEAGALTNLRAFWEFNNMAFAPPPEA
jgi:hypothetical protein